MARPEMHIDRYSARKRERDPLCPVWFEDQPYFTFRLPQDESQVVQESRRNEIIDRRKQYDLKFDLFGIKQAAPAYPTTIPETDREGLWHIVELLNQATKTAGTLVKNQLRENFFYSLFSEGEDPWAVWLRFYEGLKQPSVATRWNQDDDFARQRLAGLSPKIIKKVKAVEDIPDYFPVTEELFKSVLPASFPKHSSLAKLVRDGKVFICDYVASLENINAPPERMMQVPIALFVVDDSKEPGSALTPVLIQLQPNYLKKLEGRRHHAHTHGSAEGGESASPASAAAPAECEFDTNDAPVANGKPYIPPEMFSPLDHKNNWLAAKIHVQVADAQVHGVREHLMNTHLIAETFYTIVRRNISERHPLHELLYPHFFFTLLLNWGARNFLIANNPINFLPTIMSMGFDGQNEILRRSWEAFNFERLNPHKDIAARGCEDLPGYWYRDDGFLLFDTIEAYVKGMIHLMYPNEHAVEADEELQAMIAELLSPTGGNFRGLPCKPNGHVSRANLVEICAVMIYNVTGGHAAVNNTQWDFIGYIPNIPCNFRVMPSKKEELTTQQLVDGMPNFVDSLKQLIMFSGLSVPTDQPLGQFTATFFETWPQTRPVINEFKARLAAVEETINRRNETIRVPYTYLKPSQISASIAT